MYMHKERVKNYPGLLNNLQNLSCSSMIFNLLWTAELSNIQLFITTIILSVVINSAWHKLKKKDDGPHRSHEQKFLYHSLLKCLDMKLFKSFRNSLTFQDNSSAFLIQNVINYF